MRRWKAFFAALLASGLALAAGASPAPPKRIVSLNLCSDQYLLALADRGQIAGLTRNARDPELSAAAAQVGHIPLLSGSAEELLVIRPDLVIGIAPQLTPAVVALPGQSFRFFDLQDAATYNEMVVQIRRVAAAVGHPERGEALIARMDRRLARLPKTKNSGVAAYYQRRGFLTGAGTLVDDLMRRAGLTNLAAKLGKPAFSQMSLEELLAAQPDYLIVESAAERVQDEGTAMLHHPLLKTIRRLRIPQAWTVCAGPAYVLAAESLAAQLRR